MQTLISCVGDTDPIRNYHDGPLLHIARGVRPEKIVLIHSERSREKHEELVQALMSISDYQPEIVVDKRTISNNDIFLFDKMFETLSGIIQEYAKKEEEIILNLTSATPQIISAMFSINRIGELNVRAYQVATPNYSSNEGVLHNNGQDMQKLIAENKDNKEDYTNRLIEDKAEKFQQLLVRKTFLDLINMYDYEGAFQISSSNKLMLSKNKRKAVNKTLEPLISSIKTQNLIPEVQFSDFNFEQQTILNAYLLISLQARRDLNSEVLIRVKNFAEFITELYFDNNYPGLIVRKNELPYLNPEDYGNIMQDLQLNLKKANKELNLERYLSLPIYAEILRVAEPKSHLLKLVDKVNGVNSIRNQVAHGFIPIDTKQFKIRDLSETCWQLLKETIDVDEQWKTFFENKNHEFKNMVSY
ncbi:MULTISPECIES: type III-A CRISPR-associated CARF protein Csm6 [Tetragenococcus]|uniref:CRISPR-associated Csm6 family protein n=2 Tax=Tetragenococcus muriaticus TaxID=64642 RepID=A0A091C6M1_9ENTE|nr:MULTISPECIES: DUF1887 family protein [Tetragenococcus]KFN92559.1 CRISPR-associated Csm6 family protein [Tetragenococcus muriaticus 3MR10-3]KFN93312.1 CRISPR-associated Csm6 family protein [Tetragenococcus muriaticus PMC-11-5]MCF1613630.1 DUF1887 family protein [Tetragenococcus koreensis]MCF1623374.1 DUF1887 family protein [Tetragenococcus koreensis]